MRWKYGLEEIRKGRRMEEREVRVGSQGWSTIRKEVYLRQGGK